MRSRVLVEAIVLLIGAPVLSCAQEVGYRIDLYRDPAGAVRMRFVNDSLKDIDAYHALIRCDRSTRETDGDVLGGPYTGVDTIRASGGRWDAGPSIQEDGHVCDPTVDAVIYSDGSFDGPLQIVRRIHAAREGGLAAIQFWAELLAKPREAGAESFSAVAGTRLREDRTHLENCPTSASGRDLICSYWAGRLHDDASVSEILARPVPQDSASPWRFENFIQTWKRKYEKDAAMADFSRSYPSGSIR